MAYMTNLILCMWAELKTGDGVKAQLRDAKERWRENGPIPYMSVLKISHADLLGI